MHATLGINIQDLDTRKVFELHYMVGAHGFAPLSFAFVRKKLF